MSEKEGKRKLKRGARKNSCKKYHRVMMIVMVVVLGREGRVDRTPNE